MLILCYLGIKLANLLPLLAPLNPHQPNLHLCSTEAMASLPSHFFGPALRAPSLPLVRVTHTDGVVLEWAGGTANRQMALWSLLLIPLAHTYVTSPLSSLVFPPLLMRGEVIWDVCLPSRKQGNWGGGGG